MSIMEMTPEECHRINEEIKRWKPGGLALSGKWTIPASRVMTMYFSAGDRSDKPAVALEQINQMQNPPYHFVEFVAYAMSIAYEIGVKHQRGDLDEQE